MAWLASGVRHCVPTTMSHIQPVGLKAGEDKATVMASLRRQLMEDLRRKHSLIPAQCGESSREDGVRTPGEAGLAAARSSSPCSSSSSRSSERCGSGDDSMNIAARRKRSALMRMETVRSRESLTDTTPGGGNSVEDLSAKMSRLHSPMKADEH